MSNLADSVRDLAGLSGKTGRKKYRELYRKAVAARIEEQSRLEALESTAQLAVQQIAVLTKLIAGLKALPAPTENGDGN
jgi:hypothetical protein